ncbi:MAG TPA: hypothetical protein VK958_04125 [Methylophilus sp.]|uniref:hypothetical protein n=1 Tax=Methylophilus sp. TaxID=29541 RepID=UPI002B8D1861|nr:hypothetical protein [Methylophilus sp.]HSH86420.1 hypothetical protein [Methylophilus sp.]
MLDRFTLDYLNPDRFSEISSADRDERSDAVTEKSRESNLKRREGKSATRTVKQAMAIKHSKALKNAHD